MDKSVHLFCVEAIKNVPLQIRTMANKLFLLLGIITSGTAALMSCGISFGEGRLLVLTHVHILCHTLHLLDAGTEGHQFWASQKPLWQ